MALPVFLMAFLACETAPEPTPMPTPTATPAPLPAPILVDPNEDPRAFFQSIPEEEQQCLTQGLGQTRLDEVLDGAETTEEDNLVMDRCVSQETFARIMVGSFINQVGGLSDDTLGCVWGILRDADLKRLFTSDDDEAQVLAFQAMLDASLCLSDEEAARAAAAAGIEDFPVDGLRCLVGLVDVESLVAMFSDDQDALSAEIVVGMLECGIHILGAEGDNFQYGDEELACLKDVLGAEDLTEFFGEGGDLSLEVITALLECGLETLGTEGVDGGIGIGITAEDLACVVETLGEEALTEIMAGERLPTFGELLALVGCDLDLEALLNDS